MATKRIAARRFNLLWQGGENDRFLHYKAVLFLLVCALITPLLSPWFGFNPATRLVAHDHIYYGTVDLNHQHPTRSLTGQTTRKHIHPQKDESAACKEQLFPDVVLLPHNVAGIVSFLLVLPDSHLSGYLPDEDANLADYVHQLTHKIREISLPVPQKPPR